MEIPQGTDPLALFHETFAAAAKEAPIDHTAGTLATVSATGQPTARVVLLKGLDATGLVFFTNYRGRKSLELEGNAKACLNYWWPWIGQQVRVDGTTHKIDPAESDAYFASRPRTSQLGAWASQQSQPLSSRQELIDRVQELDRQYQDKPVPRPPHWGGYRLIPAEMEFWYDGENRLHDRFVFRRTAEGWTLTRLNP
jgi:pyridoxamine 5'-phosphate oxidase